MLQSLDYYEDTIKSGKKVEVNLIEEHDNYYEKIIIHPNLLGAANKRYYKKNFDTIHDGYLHAVDLINKCDNDIIVDFNSKEDWFLSYKTKKFPKCFDIDLWNVFEIHCINLIQKFPTFKHYVNWFVHQTYSRTINLKPFYWDEYAGYNCFVAQNISNDNCHSWTASYNIQVTDFDDLFRYKINDDPYEGIKKRFFSSAPLSHPAFRHETAHCIKLYKEAEAEFFEGDWEKKYI